MYYLYILTDRMNRLFTTGVTDDLDRALENHRQNYTGKNTRRPQTTRLVYLREFEDREEARRTAKEVSSYTYDRRAELIKGQNPEWGELRNFRLQTAESDEESATTNVCDSSCPPECAGSCHCCEECTAKTDE